jgi:hypothetical protein
METLYKGDKMSKPRTLNELRQSKAYKIPRKAEPIYKSNSRSIDHHSTIYHYSSIKTPVEWLSANNMDSETRNMEGYAGYYVDQLLKMRLI